MVGHVLSSYRDTKLTRNARDMTVLPRSGMHPERLRTTYLTSLPKMVRTSATKRDDATSYLTVQDAAMLITRNVSMTVSYPDTKIVPLKSLSFLDSRRRQE